MSNKSLKNKSKKEKKKKRAEFDTALSCVKYSLLYFLAAMIVIVPLSLVVLSSATNVVHRAQQTVSASSNEIVLDDSYEESNAKDFVNSVKVGKLLGYITNEDIGLNEKVYYGINRACLRNGAGLSSSSYLFGEGGCSKIAAYSSTSFNLLKNISVGSIITVQTYWGEFKYEVTDKYEAQSAKETEGDSLLLAVNSGTDAFSVQSGNNIYVVAELVSKEVR